MDEDINKRDSKSNIIMKNELKNTKKSLVKMKKNSMQQMIYKKTSMS